MEMLQPVEARHKLEVELSWCADLAVDHPGRRIEGMVRPQVGLGDHLLEEPGRTQHGDLPLRRVLAHECAQYGWLVGAAATHLRRQDCPDQWGIPRCKGRRGLLARR